jgi:uncharacterized protein YcgI (DUF1989 family)
MSSVRVNEAVTVERWEVHEVPAAWGGAWRVPAGGLVRVTDVQGGQSGDVFFVDAVDVTDGLSNGRSFDYNGTISLTVGSTLFSSRSRTLATIIEDDVGRHDFLYTVQPGDVRDPVRRDRAASELLPEPD